MLAEEWSFSPLLHHWLARVRGAGLDAWFVVSAYLLLLPVGPTLLALLLLLFTWQWVQPKEPPPTPSPRKAYVVVLVQEGGGGQESEEEQQLKEVGGQCGRAQCGWRLTGRRGAG